MEPELDVRTGKEFNIVQPKPFAFVQIYEQTHPKVKPKALQLDPMQVAVAREAVEGQIERENQIIEEIQHAHRGIQTPREESKHLGPATLEDIKKEEEKSHYEANHPKTRLQLQLEEREHVPAELRDHSKAHIPEIVHMPDPFHRGIRGVHSTAEDWESQSSASSKSSYSEEQAPVSRTRSKRNRSKQSVASSMAGSRRSSKISAADSGHSGVHSKVQSSGQLALEGIEEGLSDDSDESWEDAGPELPEGLYVQSASISRPPAAAKSMRDARKVGGLNGGVPAICT